MKIRLGHSPDPDDAFLFYALSAGKIDTGPYEVRPVRHGLASLNDRASRGEFEITTISVAAYPHVRDRCAMLRCGASFANGRGPRIVARDRMKEADLATARLAVSGMTTSAYAALQLYRPGLRAMILPFDKIVPAIKTGVVHCGLVCQKGSRVADDPTLYCVKDLSKWWVDKTDGLPLPLECCVVRKNLPDPVRCDLARLVRESAEYALKHRDEAMQYAVANCPNVDPSRAARFVRMAVTKLAVDIGQRGEGAMTEFLSCAEQAGIIPPALPLEMI